MAIMNPFEPGKLADLSDKINIIPNTWGLVQNLGLFRNESKTQRTVLIPRSVESVALIRDRNWNERHQANPNRQEQVLALQIPHYPLDDMITPADLNGVMNWDNANAGQAKVLAQARAEKMGRLRRSHALTLERARMQMIKNGDVWAPNATVAYNMYTEFGKSSRQTLNILLKNSSTNPLAKTQAAVQHIRSQMDNTSVVSNIVALCSYSFFNDLTNHPMVYNEYQRFIQPGMEGTFELNLRNRLGQNVFTYGGITFIEYPASVNSEAWVEANKAYAFPVGTDIFRTFYAPAERFGDVNTVAQESYYFEFPSQKRDKIEIETETNFLNVITNPDAVVTLESTSA